MQDWLIAEGSEVAILAGEAGGVADSSSRGSGTGACLLAFLSLEALPSLSLSSLPSGPLPSSPPLALFPLPSFSSLFSLFLSFRPVLLHCIPSC